MFITLVTELEYVHINLHSNLFANVIIFLQFTFHVIGKRFAKLLNERFKRLS